MARHISHTGRFEGDCSLLPNDALLCSEDQMVFYLNWDGKNKLPKIEKISFDKFKERAQKCTKDESDDIFFVEHREAASPWKVLQRANEREGQVWLKTSQEFVDWCFSVPTEHSFDFWKKNAKLLEDLWACTSAVYEKETHEEWKKLSDRYNVLSRSNDEIAWALWESNDKQHKVLSFRGTVSITNWMTNLNVKLVRLNDGTDTDDTLKKPHVHKGFKQSLQDLEKALESAYNEGSVSSKIYVTGHSLGGAIATLAGLELTTRSRDEEKCEIHVVTFGQPSVGDLRFVQSYESVLGERTTRFCAFGDPVPFTPHKIPNCIANKINPEESAEYNHVGSEINLVSNWLARISHCYGHASALSDIKSSLAFKDIVKRTHGRPEYKLQLQKFLENESNSRTVINMVLGGAKKIGTEELRKVASKAGSLIKKHAKKHAASIVGVIATGGALGVLNLVVGIASIGVGLYNAYQIKKMTSELKELGSAVEQGFAGLHHQLGHVSNQVDHVSNQVGYVSNQVDHVINQLDYLSNQIDQGFGSIENTMKELSEKVDRATQNVIDQHTNNEKSEYLQKVFGVLNRYKTALAEKSAKSIEKLEEAAYNLMALTQTKLYPGLNRLPRLSYIVAFALAARALTDSVLLGDNEAIDPNSKDWTGKQVLSWYYRVRRKFDEKFDESKDTVNGADIDGSKLHLLTAEELKNNFGFPLGETKLGECFKSQGWNDEHQRAQGKGVDEDDIRDYTEEELKKEIMNDPKIALTPPKKKKLWQIWRTNTGLQDEIDKLKNAAKSKPTVRAKFLDEVLQRIEQEVADMLRQGLFSFVKLPSILAQYISLYVGVCQGELQSHLQLQFTDMNDAGAIERALFESTHPELQSAKSGLNHLISLMYTTLHVSAPDGESNEEYKDFYSTHARELMEAAQPGIAEAFISSLEQVFETGRNPTREGQDWRKLVKGQHTKSDTLLAQELERKSRSKIFTSFLVCNPQAIVKVPLQEISTVLHHISGRCQVLLDLLEADYRSWAEVPAHLILEQFIDKLQEDRDDDRQISYALVSSAYRRGVNIVEALGRTSPLDALEFLQQMSLASAGLWRQRVNDILCAGGMNFMLSQAHQAVVSNELVDLDVRLTLAKEYIQLRELAKIESGDGAERGRTALMEACSKGQYVLAKLIVESGANKEAADNNGWTALMWACSEGNYKCAKSLVDSGVELNTKARSGYLITAASYQTSRDGVRIGLHQNGSTALMMACVRGSYDCAKLLVENEAKKEAKNNDGITALMHSCLNGNYDCAKLLVKSGAETEAKDINGWTALMLACYNGNYICAKLLVDSGANKEAKSNYESTALMLACFNGNYDCAKLLVDSEAKTEAKNKYGNTALIAACNNGNYDCAKLLVESGANKEATNKDGWTALICACYKGNYDCAKLLVKSGANKKAKNEFGWTAMSTAKDRGHTNIVDLLKA